MGFTNKELSRPLMPMHPSFMGLTFSHPPRGVDFRQMVVEPGCHTPARYLGTVAQVTPARKSTVGCYSVRW